MPSYPASKIKKAFEILQRSGTLDNVEKDLEQASFSVQISDDDAALLASKLNEALKTLEVKDKAFYDTVTGAGQTRVLKASGHCPC